MWYDHMTITLIPIIIETLNSSIQSKNFRKTFLTQLNSCDTMRLYDIIIPRTAISHKLLVTPTIKFAEEMTAATTNNRKVINSVQKALDILGLFNAQNPELGTTEIARALEMPKSTASGLVQTLEYNGYLEQNPENRKYRLGLKLVELGSVLLNQLDLRQLAQPYLETLRDWCNEGINLAILHNGEVVYIERLLGTSMLGMRSEIGKREPVHSTALGKAILSYWSNQEVRSYLEQHELSAITPQTITDHETLIRELSRIRALGFALDDQENELGGRCVAAPIIDYRGRPVAAVSISAPIQRLPDEQIPLFGSKVKQAAQGISRQLGGLGLDTKYQSTSDPVTEER